MKDDLLDHHGLIRSLTPEQRRRLTRKSDLRGLAALALHWGLIGLFGWLIAVRAPTWPLWLVPQGVLIVFLFTLLHETSHRTPFAAVWINKAVAWVCGLLIVLPPEWFRHFHFAHHRHTQDPERDPELAAAKPETFRAYVLHLSGLPTWWDHARTLMRNALGRCDDPFVPKSGRGRVRREARVMVAAYALMAGGSAVLGSADLLFVWLVPAIIGQPFLRLYLMAEHGRCPHVANMFENSRTTFTNCLVRGIAWNMPYHAEHHAYPAIPFHRLPALHVLARAHLRETEAGYLRFQRGYLADLAGSPRRPKSI